MYAWETLHRYAQYHERWYESANSYNPGDEHLAVVRAVLPDTWKLRRLGMNIVAEPPGPQIPEQGWKLHVSAVSREGAEVLRAAVPVLRDSGAHFKFIGDRRLTFMTNSKTWSRGAAGKFITVYPRSDEEFHRLAAALTEALRGFTGIYVLSDRRVPGADNVFYRYGGFRARWRLTPEGDKSARILTPDGGEIPDVRHPFYNPPAWATDPFGAEAEAEEDGEDSTDLAEGRFVVKDALHFSNRGGVYLALDTHTGREVVIKEARPGVELSPAGTDAISTLEKEYHLLELLADTGLYVAPVAFFREWEHAFLVEDHLEGDHLGHVSISNNPLYRTEFTAEQLAAYWQRMLPLWVQLAEAIAAAHERGIVLGDISFTNIMVVQDPDGTERIKVIDLEAAVRPGTDPALPIYTKGLASERFVRTGVSDEANDWHALGGILLGSLALVHTMLGFHPGALDAMLDSLAADLGVPAELTALIRELRDTSDTAQPQLAGAARAVAARITALAGPLGAQRPALLTCPAHEALPEERLDALRTRVQDTVTGVGRYLAGVADPRREDRLFPADPVVFETNPMSVAFGACGVAYALNRITGKVPAAVRGWLLRKPVDSRTVPPGLYLGQAGVAWVFDDLGYPELAERVIHDAIAHPLVNATPDVLVGDAGIGLACLQLWQRTGEQALLDQAHRLATGLVERRKRDARGSFWSDADGRIAVGYARGTSGIATFLLYAHLATGDDRLLAVGREALDFDLGQAGQIDGRFAGFPSAVQEEPGDHEVFKGYWDEGTAGIATTAVRYLAVQRDPALRDALSLILPDVHRKYAVLPQLFHGLAGPGNLLLDLWELTGDERHYREACRVAEGTLLFRVERPEGFAFPGEQALRESADLASGASGVGLFLHRLLTARPGGRTNFNFLPDGLLPQDTLPRDLWPETGGAR